MEWALPPLRFKGAFSSSGFKTGARQNATDQGQHVKVPARGQGLGLSSLRDVLTCRPSPKIGASWQWPRKTCAFQACESSRQGATATPTAVLLSSFRKPTSTAGVGALLPERDGGDLPGYNSQLILAAPTGESTKSSFGCQGTFLLHGVPFPIQ
jgi:hypothetical protein